MTEAEVDLPLHDKDGNFTRRCQSIGSVIGDVSIEDAIASPKSPTNRLHRGDPSAASSRNLTRYTVHGDAMTQSDSLSRPLSRSMASTPSLPRIHVERPASGQGVPDWMARPPSPWTDAAFGKQNAPWFRNLIYSKHRTTQRLCAVTGHKKQYTAEECWSWPLAQVFAASPLRDRPGRLHLDQYRETFAQHREEVKHDVDLAGFIAATEVEVEHLQEADHLSHDQQARLRKLETRLLRIQKYRDASIRRLDRLDEQLQGVRKQHPSDRHLAECVAQQLGSRLGRGDANLGVSASSSSVLDVQGGTKEIFNTSRTSSDPKRKGAFLSTRKSGTLVAGMSQMWPGRLERGKSIDHANWLKQRLMLEAQSTMQNLEQGSFEKEEAPQKDTVFEAAQEANRDTILPGRPLPSLSPRRFNQHREERKRRRTKKIVEIEGLTASKALQDQTDSPQGSENNTPSHAMGAQEVKDPRTTHCIKGENIVIDPSESAPLRK